jgi:integrative and conjugative element protein (TIGR02256 family)
LSELSAEALTTRPLHITTRALAAIAEHAVASADGLETGGILLGYDAYGLGAPLVMEAGGPGPNAQRRNDFFQRDLTHAQALAEDAFTRSCSRWIGEWHTHLQDPLAPSRQDLRTYYGFLRDSELGFDSFVALIVGVGKRGWQHPRAAAWLIEPRRILPALLLPSAQLLELETAHLPSSGIVSHGGSRPTPL